MSDAVGPETNAASARRLLAIVRQLALELHPGHAGPVTLDTSFSRELGFDARAHAELMLRAGNAFGVGFALDALPEADTPRDLLRCLQGKPEQPPGRLHWRTEQLSQKAFRWSYGCYMWAVFVLVMLVCGGLIALLRWPPRGRRIARFAARLMFKLAGMPLSGIGLERLPATQHLLLVNHTSFVDAIVLTALLPPEPGYAFVARQEFASQRVLCPLLRGVGTVVLRPVNARRESSDINRITAALRRGQRLALFPEGGFRPEPGLRPFHSGAFVAAAGAGVPIVIAGLRGARDALRPGTWLPRRVAITLEIGPMLPPPGDGPAAVTESAAAARKAMLRLCGEPELRE